MMPRRRSAPWFVGLAPLGLFAAIACGSGDDSCDPRAGWCGGDPELRLLATPVDDAVVVDLDGDGEDEAVMLSRDGRKLTLAHGTDIRAWRTSVVLGESPMALAALPGEVAVALGKPPQLAIFGMDADRRLVRRRDILLSQRPVRLDSADLAGDGAPELLVALPDAKAIAVVDPRDGAVREYKAGEEPVDLEVGDVDGDTHADVVVVDAAGALQLLRGAGDGTLKPAVAQLASVGEFWPDRRVELVTQDGPTIYRHEDGDPERRVALVSEEAATLLRVADVDGDERYDLTVVEQQATFAWLLGDGPPARVQLAEAPLAVVAYPDVDGDGAPDLVGLAGDGMLMRRGRRPSANVP